MALAALLLVFAAPPPSMFQYNWTAGALDAVADVAPASHHTVASAEALCTGMPLCGGFTYGGCRSRPRSCRPARCRPAWPAMRFVSPTILHLHLPQYLHPHAQPRIPSGRQPQ